MDMYKKIQSGLISAEQYNAAVMELFNKKTKKQSRKTLQTADETKRRKSLRTLTKWFFDVECGRKTTPLYHQESDKKPVWSEFVKIADKVILFASHDYVVSAAKRSELYHSIDKLVENRRKNIRDSKKPRRDGTQKKRLKLIYETQSRLMATASDGQSVLLEPPQPLPLTKASSCVVVDSSALKTALTPSMKTTPTPSMKTAPTPSLLAVESPLSTTTTLPSPASMKPSLTPPPTTDTPVGIADPLFPDDAVEPLLVTTTALPVAIGKPLIPNDGDDFDILEMQQTILEMQRRVKMKQAELRAKDEEKQLKKQPQKKNWIRTADSLTENAMTTKTCLNSDCGKDFLVELAEDQNGVPILCKECWEGEKQSLLSISSSTGATKPNKKKRKAKTLSVESDITTPRKKQAKRPATPVGKALKRTGTPPTIKKVTTNKFKVRCCNHPLFTYTGVSKHHHYV